MEEPDKQVHGCVSAAPGDSRLLVAGLTAALATTVAVAPDSQTANASGRHRSQTDTYVSAWDAVGTQAFTAAALSPAEGHVIFGYAGIAVYDAVMAVRHKYEPFAIRTSAPRGASPEAAVVAAAHRIYEHYLPAQEATILDPAYDASLATIPDGQAKTDGVAVGLRVANALIALRADDGFRADVGYTPAESGAPGRLGPDRSHAPRRDLPRTHATLRPGVRRPVPTGRTSLTREQALGS